VSSAKAIPPRATTAVRAAAWTLALVYLPFGWLVFTEWQILKLGPIFPGMVVLVLLQDWTPAPIARPLGYPSGFAATAVWLVLVFFGVLRARRNFWPWVGAICAGSCALAVVGYLMIKA
jgi:hypothetical protein